MRDAVETYENEEKPLTTQEKLMSYILINVYELIVGFVAGTVMNEIAYMLVPFSSSESMLKSVVSSFLIGTITITIVLYLRDKIEELPLVRDYKNRPGFKHPPPIAMGFAFWISQNQLRARRKALQDSIFELIGSKRVVTI